MTEATSLYLLPSHPSISSLDPLSVCDDDNPTAWAVIAKSIKTFRAQPGHTIHHLPHLIEDLSYSVQKDGNVDTKFLRKNLAEIFPGPDYLSAAAALDSILDAALSMPFSFPSNTLRYIDKSHPLCELQSPQIVCLLSHQILNTLSPPPSNDWGCTFIMWYSEPQALEEAVAGYLRTIFDFFTLKPWSGLNVSLQYHLSPAQESVTHELTTWKNCMALDVCSNIFLERVSNRNTPFPHGRIACTLVASNKYPGFGPACTQEELVTAACPPLLLLGALFILPPLHSEAVLVARGNFPVAKWVGQGRYARYQGMTSSDYYTFLFLDAAELDHDQVTQGNLPLLPDLMVDNFTRDLHKAYVGFQFLTTLGCEEIASPLWGAGSFGGNPVVKFLILGAAAARAGIKVYLTIEEERYIAENSSAHTVPNSLFSSLEELKSRCTETSVGEMVMTGPQVQIW
ncbi:hypothetical protein CPB83DRAFT_878669, partial [Crepidotus variabilis]